MIQLASRRNAGAFMQKACRDFCGDSLNTVSHGWASIAVGAVPKDCSV